MEENMKKEIKDVMDGLTAGFEKEADDEFLLPIEEMIKKYHYLDLTNPEDFNSFVFSVFNRPMDVLVRKVLAQQSVSRKIHYRVGFIYEHYDFISFHLKNIIYQYEGMACSTDKSRWLIDTYLNYVLTGEYKEIEGDYYYHPLIKDVKLWLNWMETMQDLYGGNEEKYMIYKQQLRKEYEHTINKTMLHLDKIFRDHPFFVHYQEDEKYKVYEFVDAKAKDKGIIYVTEQATLKYNYYFGEEQRRSTYKNPLPQWFDALLKTK